MIQLSRFFYCSGWCSWLLLIIIMPPKKTSRRTPRASSNSDVPVGTSTRNRSSLNSPNLAQDTATTTTFSPAPAGVTQANLASTIASPGLATSPSFVASSSGGEELELLRLQNRILTRQLEAATAKNSSSTHDQQPEQDPDSGKTDERRRGRERGAPAPCHHRLYPLHRLTRHHHRMNHPLNQALFT